jgi:hypothetical protein
MTEQQNTQIDALAGQLVTHQRFFADMSVADRQWAFQNPRGAIAIFCGAVQNRTEKVVKRLFESVATFKVPGAKEFVAKKKFVVDTSESARVRISYLGETFKRVMLPKVERDIAEADLKLQKLLDASLDLPENSEKLGTIAGLGGMEKAEASLYAFHETLAYKQSIRDFSWVVGYARDAEGILWAVGAYWGGDGWSVEASSVGNPGRWDVGSEFVSR